MKQHSNPRNRLVGAVASSTLIAMALAGCSGTVTGADPDSQSRTLKIASYAGASTADTAAVQEWAELVTEYTDGGLEFEFYLSGSLLAATEIMAGVAAGTVDLGVTSHGYHPGELPLSHVMNVGFVTTNYPAAAASMRELYATDQALEAEWTANGVRPLLFANQSAAVVGCKEPIESIDDLKGKTVRASALTVEDFASIGANVATLVAAEVLESLERGVIDCWAGFPLEQGADLGLVDATPYIYDYGRGSTGALEFMIGTALWDSLSDEEREAMDRAADEVASRYGEILSERVSAACDKAADAGATVIHLDDEERERWRELAEPANVAKFLQIAPNGGEAFLEEYRETVADYTVEFSDFVDPTELCTQQF